ncbi:hypothetical protein [Ligilactobacillus animalis]|uniref:hypothetical protein n=1 Tax=Ligilactobacillus animalis TaxID=1605 RepID=UPI000826B903|nr:hypothetical protein [Ligilactobacillus animalis]OCX49484.1 hypothetical protein BFC98_01010 [Ligilactobacillus animalis]QHQ70615.1 hypothetical protein GSR62_07875 [Ligilactobacillus animalis]
MRSEEFIRENVTKYFDDSNVLITPAKTDKEKKKVVNAAQKIANGINPAFIAAIYDTTLLGSGKEGIVFTGEKLFYKEAFEAPVEIDLSKVVEVEYLENKIVNSKGKESIECDLVIKLEESDDIKLHKGYVTDTLKALGDFLNELANEVSETVSTDHQVILTDCSDEAILAYLKIVTNFIKHDGKVETKEYVSLAGLIGGLQLGDKLSDELRKYRNSAEMEDNDSLISTLKREIPEGSQSEIFQGLVNDLILTTPFEKYDEVREEEYFKDIQEKLGVTDEQIDVFIKKSEQDKKIIEERTTDKEAKKMREELAGIAGAAGASLAAFGVTGVVVGAFGELGLGTLAFATMSTGGLALAVAGITTAGIVGYNGVKKLSSSKTEDSIIRQTLLQEAIKRHEMGMQLMLSDINYITKRIVDLSAKINKSDEAREQLKKLVERLSKTNNAINHAKQDEEYRKRELILSELPETLEVEKLNDLLKQNINGDKFGMALDEVYNYKEGENRINEESELKNLKVCKAILENIEYYKVATMANAKNVGKKLWSKLNN